MRNKESSVSLSADQNSFFEIDQKQKPFKLSIITLSSIFALLFYLTHPNSCLFTMNPSDSKRSISSQLETDDEGSIYYSYDNEDSVETESVHGQYHHQQHQQRESTPDAATILATADRLFERLCEAGRDAKARSGVWREAAEAGEAIVDRLKAIVIQDIQQADKAVQTQQENNERVLLEQVDFRIYANSQSFGLSGGGINICCFEYGGMPFAARTREKAEALVLLLSRLFTASTNLRLQCPRRCQNRFKNMLDLHHHMEHPCDAAPPTHVTETWLKVYPIAFYVSDEDIDFLEKTAENHKDEPMDLLDPNAMPFAIGDSNAHHYPNTSDENQRENQHKIAKGTTLFSLLTWKAKWLEKYSRDPMYSSMPFLLCFPFVKAPSDPTFPEEARTLLEEYKIAVQRSKEEDYDLTEEEPNEKAEEYPDDEAEEYPDDKAEEEPEDRAEDNRAEEEPDDRAEKEPNGEACTAIAASQGIDSSFTADVSSVQYLWHAYGKLSSELRPKDDDEPVVVTGVRRFTARTLPADNTSELYKVLKDNYDRYPKDKMEEANEWKCDSWFASIGDLGNRTKGHDSKLFDSYLRGMRNRRMDKMRATISSFLAGKKFQNHFAEEYLRNEYHDPKQGDKELVKQQKLQLIHHLRRGVMRLHNADPLNIFNPYSKLYRLVKTVLAKFASTVKAWQHANITTKYWAVDTKRPSSDKSIRTIKADFEDKQIIELESLPDQALFYLTLIWCLDDAEATLLDIKKGSFARTLGIKKSVYDPKAKKIVHDDFNEAGRRFYLKVLANLQRLNDISVNSFFIHSECESSGATNVGYDDLEVSDGDYVEPETRLKGGNGGGRASEMNAGGDDDSTPATGKRGQDRNPCPSDLPTQQKKKQK